MSEPYRPDPSTRFLSALADLVSGARHYELWGMMGWQDIRQRYSRSVLGPVWPTPNMGLMVLGLGILYAGLFHQTIDAYLPFLTLASSCGLWSPASWPTTPWRSSRRKA